jgi:hypothetical protein
MSQLNLGIVAPGDGIEIVFEGKRDYRCYEGEEIIIGC